MIGGASYYELAEEAFTQALELDPRLVEPQLGMVDICLIKGQKERAREQMRNLLRTASNDSNVHFFAANIYRLDGLYKQALTEYGHMLRMNPNDVVVVSYNRARVLLYQHMFEDAIAELETALAIEPGHAFARAILGKVYYHAGQRQQAIEVLSDVLQKNPEMHGARPLLAACYIAEGDEQNMRALITPQVIDNASADHDVAYWLASVYALQGNKVYAIKWLKKAIELGNENYPWFAIDINWQKLREEPEYIEIMKDLQQRWEQLSAAY
jgi:serine/threonine-protein kinase